MALAQNEYDGETAPGSRELSAAATTADSHVSMDPLVSAGGLEGDDESLKPSPTVAEKARHLLSDLGLAPETFEFLVRRFLGNRFSYVRKPRVAGARSRRPADRGSKRRAKSGPPKPGRHSPHYLAEVWKVKQVREPEQVRPPSWRTFPGRYLSDLAIVRHLAGEHWVGTGARWDAASHRFRTDYFLVDLDRKRPEDEADLWLRYRGVVTALGWPTCVFQSSASGGLHLYYLLAEPVLLSDLRSRYGWTGAVMRLLDAQGLSEEPGRVEVYPRGEYRTGLEGRARLPFGADSALLDVHTLEPLHPGRPLDDLRHLECREAGGELDLVDPTELFAAAVSAPRNYSKLRARALPYRASSGGSAARRDSDAAQRAAPFWEDGLTRAGQRTTAVTALAYDLLYRGVELEEAKELVRAWFAERENDQSETYRLDPDGALRDNDAIIERIYARRARQRAWLPVAGLSAYEASTILGQTATDEALRDPGPSVNRPRTAARGRAAATVLSRYKAQAHAFFLLLEAKRWVLTEAQRVVERVAARNARLSPESAEFRAQFLQAFAHVWPDPSRPEFLVDIPARLRRKSPGMGKDTELAYWRVLSHPRGGLFRRERPACDWLGRAARYRVTLDFGARSSSIDVAFTSIAAAITAQLPRESIREQYSRHHAAALVSGKKGGTTVRIAPEERTLFEQITQRELRRQPEPAPLALAA